jgi:aryl-alcohol dehydrogenase-like predicted oxidoreductase
MRYRPLAHQTMALSAISLRLDDRFQRNAAGWSALVLAALDCGINCFEVTGRSPALVDGVGQALRSVERRLVYLAWRFGPLAMPPQYAQSAFSPGGMEGLAKAIIARTGLEHIDLIQLHDPGQSLSAQGLQTLKQMKARGMVHALGVAGDGEDIDAYISTGAFDTLTTPFNMLSGSRERRRMKAAGDRNMSVMGYAYYPEAMLAVAEAAKPKKGLLSWNTKGQAIAPQPYTFLHTTSGWTAEEICLAYALTEPSLSSVQIEPENIVHLQALAAVAERELPSSLPAQIEMSRFSNVGKDVRSA